MNAQNVNRITKPAAWALCIVATLDLTACSSEAVRGRVIGVWEDQVTVRKENDRIVTVKVENIEEVRVLDTVVIKDKRAKIKNRVIESD